MSRKSAGFIHLIPLLIITFVAISVLALSLEPRPKKNISTAVLSESESGGGRGSDSSGSSGSGSSGSGSSDSSSGLGGTLEIRKIETPEPKETPEIKDQNEDEDEQELELEDETEFEVHEGTEAARVKIGKRENKFVFFEQRFGAESEFPVSVNKATRELTIQTPQGTRVVAILPDTAVENMLGQNVIDKVLGTGGRIVEVKIDANGNVFYEISGAKNEKFLGVFNVLVPKTLDVSGQTGNLTKVNQDPLSQLLDALSF